MGLLKELFARLETRRALGEHLSEGEYGWFRSYPGPEAVNILGEGVKKHPESVSLQTAYMELLAKAGRKEEAWRAYERARDLYFALVERSETPTLAGDGGYNTELLTVLVARPWYIFILQEGKDDEFRRLEDRLREVCLKTKEDAKSLLVPRAFAEFGVGRYAAAVETLETCVKLKIWNDVVNEAMVTAALAKSLRAVGRRDDAIKSYRRAVEISGVDPGLLSEFLCLVVEVDGVLGLLRELPAYEKTRQRPDVRLNATLSCFDAWVVLAAGNDKLAFEYMVQAVQFVGQASQQPAFGGDEMLVCEVLLLVVAEKLGDTRRAAVLSDFLKHYPVERVKAMRDVFALPKQKRE
jgi:tetratricopeptide (TPR) repeat protein